MGKLPQGSLNISQTSKKMQSPTVVLKTCCFVICVQVYIVKLLASDKKSIHLMMVGTKQLDKSY